MPLNEPTALELPHRRWGLLSTDCITFLPKTPRGYDAITTWVDGLSRRVHFYPSKTTDAAPELAQSFFERIIPQHGLPDAIFSDRDPRFLSKFWQELFLRCGVQLKTSSVRHPQTDGASEVMKRVIENYIRCYCECKQEDWDKLLTAAEFAYNSAVSEDLGMSPYEVDLGWKPRDPLDILSGSTPRVQSVCELKETLRGAIDDAIWAHKLAKSRQSAEAALHCKPPDYQVGGWVWVSRHL